jgi:two-component system response regulator YesN
MNTNIVIRRKEYKILIVEDFEADRMLIGEIIDEISDLPILLSGQCENALQAYDMLHETGADIIICDIQMPYINGLEFARKAIEEFPNVQFIFCSLYDSFNYVKEALKLHSIGYLLKPIDKKELYDCISQAIIEIEERILYDIELKGLRDILLGKIDMLRNSFYHDLIFGLINDRSEMNEKLEFLSIDVGECVTYLALIEIDDLTFVAKNANVERPVITMKLLQALQQFTYGKPLTCGIRLDDSHFAYIRSFKKNAYKESKTILHIVEAECEQFIRLMKQDGLSVTIAIGHEISDLMQLNVVFERCRYQLRFKYTLGSGQVISSTEIPDSRQRLKLDLNSIMREIRYLLSSDTENDEICSFITSLFSTTSNPPQCQGIVYALTLSILMAFREYDIELADVFPNVNIWEKIQSFEDIDGVKMWFLKIIRNGRMVFSEMNKNAKLRLIRNIKCYVKSGDLKLLNLPTIASEFHYSPNHINTLFKHITGETISEYVTKERIKRARLLLSDPNIRIYDVATEVGYSHAAHFNNVFKKNVGVSPKEYRDNYNDKFI